MADTSIKEVSLEELMEVVTSYKCKFCDYACTGIGEMTDHLNNTHVVRQHTVPKSTVASETESQEALKSERDLACNEEGVTDEGSVGTFGTPALLSHLGLASTAEAHNAVLGRSDLPDPSVLTSQVRSVAKNLTISATAGQEMSLFSITPSTASATLQNVPLTTLQLSGAGLTLATATTAVANADTLLTFASAVDARTVDNTKDLGTGPSSIVPPPPPSVMTRELFLCGTCNVGFMSMDEVRLHMVQEHAAPGQGGHVSDTVIDRLDQRVSVGTQATGKRPGRKRKSEMQPQSPPQRRKKNPDEDDVDWLPSRWLYNREGQSRRKIKAPKALMQDYVMEPKRKYRKRQVSKEIFTFTCSFMGCSTKFRCQEALDVHLQCHNKEDDAFTCIKCNELFLLWKPLRIHLWRVHSVDCDMFQCDACEYKTDTVHKLGVHQEIHSDNRPYTCDLCGKGFKQLSQMKNHQIIHTDNKRSDKTTWFSSKTCEVCKRSFANSKCLKKHIEAVHGLHKPFKCSFCNHTTAWKAMLILHERIHTGEKPFKCDICPYATGDHNSLRRHKMRHSGKKQYQCQLCPYTCIQTISLKTHMRNKHPNAKGIVYLCPKCKFRTINKIIYENHLMDHNNGLIVDNKVDMGDGSVGQLATYTVEGLGGSVNPSGYHIVKSLTQFQLQVKRMESGDLHANKEDIDRLNAMPQFANSGLDANQLIYTALNISLAVGKETMASQGLNYTAQLPNGVHCNVTSTPGALGRGVVYTYVITFFNPTPQISVATTTTATVTTSAGDGEQDALMEMSVEGEGEVGESGVSEVEASSSDTALPTGSQATEVLYTHIAQGADMDGSSQDNQQPVSGSSSSADFKMVQVTFSDAVAGEDGDKVVPAVSMSDTNGEVVGDGEMRIITDSGQVITSSGQIIDSGQLATSSGSIITDSGQVVSDSGEVMTSTGQLVQGVMVIENGHLVQRMVVMSSAEQGDPFKVEDEGVEAFTVQQGLDDGEGEDVETGAEVKEETF